MHSGHLIHGLYSILHIELVKMKKINFHSLTIDSISGKTFQPKLIDTLPRGRWVGCFDNDLAILKTKNWWTVAIRR